MKANPDHPYSVDYRRGFVDGFADYLYAGGSGEPPVVPPWRYRKASYETPEGYAAIEDWFAGFRHGANVALASGLRNLVVLPVALPDQPLFWGEATPITPANPEENLPPPRVVPPTPGKKPAAPANGH